MVSVQTIATIVVKTFKIVSFCVFFLNESVTEWHNAVRLIWYALRGADTRNGFKLILLDR